MSDDPLAQEMEGPLDDWFVLFAMLAHEGQTDKLGAPYWKHCAAVALNTAAYEGGEDERVVGWLHDVEEDTPWKLAKPNFPADKQAFTDGFLQTVNLVTGKQAYALKLLRRLEGQDYEQYIADLIGMATGERLDEDSPSYRWIRQAAMVSVRVKLGDLAHNLDESRLSKVGKVTRAKLEAKYLPTREKLQKVLEENDV